MDVDVKALVTQDEDFALYLKDCIYNMMMQDGGIDAMVKAIYGFYTLGLSKEQVATWWRSMQLLKKRED